MLFISSSSATAQHMRLVSVTEAVNRGEDLHEVCDADSAVLEAAYWAVFDENGETKEELDIEPGWNNLLYVEGVEIQSEYRETTLAVRLIETAIAIFCSDGLVIAVEEAFDLTIEDWRELGFKRIAGSEFVFGDQLRVNPYGRNNVISEGPTALPSDRIIRWF